MSFEMRCIGAFARPGQDDKTWRMVWGEVVHRDKAEATFIGDMSHGRVGSYFVRSMWDLVGHHGAQ
jgi:hypothetical protein